MAEDYTADANCQGAWLFDDDLTDESGEGNTLTASGSPAYSTDRPSGYATGKSVDFNSATSDCLYRADADLSASFPGKGATQDFAYAFWVKFDVLVTYMCPIGKYAYGFFCVKEESDLIRHYQHDSGWTGLYTDLEVVSNTDTWYHVVISLNGDGTDTVRTAWISTESSFGDILNAEQDTMTDVGNLIVESSVFAIGQRGDGYYYLDGHVYQPIVLNRVLSAAEAEEIYTNGINGAEGAAAADEISPMAMRQLATLRGE